MTTRKLTYHTDPAHGWLEVNRADLDLLDIAHKISPYSYERGIKVYLEEDCDAFLYLETARAKGWKITTTTKHTDEDSQIRDYPKYQYRVTPAALINAAQRFGNLTLVHITNEVRS